jgi:hypothetical protein
VRTLSNTIGLGVGDLSMEALHALLVLAIYLIPFIVIGMVARVVMERMTNGSDLSDIQDQAGDGRRKVTGFLLGIWYRRD